ncbi:unnamed protein product [Caenorhabditis sp. 36 PRJEB53466]|nr:unnamed protein product [Caenorhabditis sp. 36 PRJEB53466]
MRGRRPPSTAFVFLSLLLLSLVPPIEVRRGGGGGLGGGSRGSSGARASSGSRGGSSGSRTSGGIFGGGRASGTRMNEYSRGTNLGQNRGTASGGGGWNTGNSGGSSGGWNNRAGSSNMNTGSKGGFLGGLFGRKQRPPVSGGWGSNRWTSSGLGSRNRGSQFKNMIVGAAAGYLTYQAGKAIIRAAAGPMMWNNRPYYWGSNYYRSNPGHSNMCRMPIESGDSQFGNVYFQDQSRPREIVWGCGYYEHCCGYECCRGGGSVGSDRIGGRGSSIGLLLLICFGFCCAFPLITRWVRRRQFGAAA